MNPPASGAMRYARRCAGDRCASTNAGHGVEPDLLCRHHPPLAGDDYPLRIDQNRVRKAEFYDARDALRHWAGECVRAFFAYGISEIIARRSIAEATTGPVFNLI